MKHKSGFTLQELLIVIAILALAFTFMLAFLNPITQLAKARDGKRKSDLNKLRIILEDFYNDHNCYPKPTEICYDALTDDDIPCHICGYEKNPLPNFSLPCNPSHPKLQYLYDVENSDCPQWYRIYTKLQFEEDKDSIELGCGFSSCGPGPDYGYDYGISSPGKGLEKNEYLYCYDPSNTCGICGSVNLCQDSLDRGACLEIYPSLDACCQDHPGANGCS